MLDVPASTPRGAPHLRLELHTNVKVLNFVTMSHPSHNEKGPTNSLGFGRRQWLVASLIIVILSGMGYAAWNPRQRAAEKRDEERSQEIGIILNALKDDYVENNTYIPSVAAMKEGTVMMIVSGFAKTTGCDIANTSCGLPVEGSQACVDISELVARHRLSEIPVAPEGDVAWDNGATSESVGTGYTLERRGATLLIRSCEAEAVDFIESVR